MRRRTLGWTSRIGAVTLALAAGMGLGASGARADVTVSARLSPAKVYTDARATLEVAWSFPGDGGAYEVEGPVLRHLEGAVVEGCSSETRTVWDRDGVRTEVLHRYALRPSGEGRVRVDSVLVAWVDASTGETGVRVVNAGEVRAVRRPPLVGALMRHPVRSAVGAGLVIGGAGVLVTLLRRRRPGVTAEAPGTPEEVLEEDVRKLRLLARQGALAPFSEGAARAVRTFVDARYGVPAGRLPTPAVVDLLETKDAPPAAAAAAGRVLGFVDDMRFGLRVPSREELEAVLGDIESLLLASFRGGERGAGR